MPSWVIVGSARGIGFEYVNQLSADKNNTVCAFIRSQKTAGPINELAASRENIHVIETDISSPSQLNETVEKVSNATNGKLDVLVYNAYLAGTESIMLPPTQFVGKEEALEKEIFEPMKVNVLQQISTINAFLPLIRKGELKKIVYITSGIADINLNRICELPGFMGYSISKASGNIVMAKYSVELKQEGIKTLSLAPGWVETDTAQAVSESPEAFQFMLSAFQKLKPSVTGMTSVDKAVRDMLTVIDSLDESKSGLFLSQHGNDDWIS